MLRFIPLLLLSTLFCPKVKAQSLQWLDYFDSLTVFIRELKTDVNNDIVVAGNFMNTVDFDPGAGTATYSAAGMFNSDGFVARYNSNGVFQWVIVSGSGSTENYDHICIDSNGDIVVLGTFYGNYDMDPGAGVATAVRNGNSDCDIVLLRFTGTGTFIWGKFFGGVRGEFINDLAMDATGKIIVVGGFTDVCDLNPWMGVDNVYAVGGFSDYDIFCSAFDAGGNYLWGWSIGTTVNNWAHSVTTDVDGNIYITGYFSDTIDFDPSPSQYLEYSTYSGFLAKYTPAGNFAWTKTFYNFPPSQVCINQQQNLYLAGNYAGSFDADPGAAVTNMPAVAGYEVAVLCFDTSGNFLRAGSITGPANQMMIDGGMDVNGNFYLCGQFEAPADFDPGAGTTTLTPATWRDPYIATVDDQLNLVSAVHIPCAGGEGGALYMTSDSNGDYIAYGRFSGVADFDPGPASYTINSQAANLATFIVKYSEPTGIEEGGMAAGFTVYPNPSSGCIHLQSDRPMENFTAELYDSRGRVIRTYSNLYGTTATLDVSGIAAGMYTIALSAGTRMKIIIE